MEEQPEHIKRDKISEQRASDFLVMLEQVCHVEVDVGRGGENQTSGYFNVGKEEKDNRDDQQGGYMSQMIRSQHHKNISSLLIIRLYQVTIRDEGEYGVK